MPRKSCLNLHKNDWLTGYILIIQSILFHLVNRALLLRMTSSNKNKNTNWNGRTRTRFGNSITTNRIGRIEELELESGREELELKLGIEELEI